MSKSILYNASVAARLQVVQPSALAFYWSVLAGSFLLSESQVSLS